jgi:hypothetical protein
MCLSGHFIQDECGPKDVLEPVVRCEFHTVREYCVRRVGHVKGGEWIHGNGSKRRVHALFWGIATTVYWGYTMPL